MEFNMQQLKGFVVLSPVGLSVTVKANTIIKGCETFRETYEMSNVFSSNDDILHSHQLAHNDSASCFARHGVALPIS